MISTTLPNVGEFRTARPSRSFPLLIQGPLPGRTSSFHSMSRNSDLISSLPEKTSSVFQIHSHPTKVTQSARI